MRCMYRHAFCMSLSLAATVQGVGLVILLRIKVGRLGVPGVVLSWLRVILITMPMAIAVHFISRLGRWPDGGNAPQNIGVVGLAVVTGVVVFGVTAFLFRVPELKELMAAFRKRGVSL